MTYFTVSRYDIPQLQEHLLANMSSSGRTDGHWLALFDRAFDDGRKAMNWSAPQWPIYHQGKLADFETIAPTLLQLATDNSETLQQQLLRLLRHCQGRPMLSFLFSRKDPATLRDAWQPLLEVATEDGLNFLLRFADTRTLPAIAEVLWKDVWPHLSDGIDQWLYPDREGNLRALDLPESKQSLREAPHSPIRITDKALDGLLRQGQPDALAQTLHEHFPDLLPTGDGAMTYKCLTDTCKLAETSGIEAFPELVALAVAILASEDNLLESPDFSAWLKEGAWAPGRFATALGDYLESVRR